VTIDAGVESDDPNPTSTVLRAIAGQEEDIRDAIVRLNISLTAEIEGQLRDNDIRDALKEAHYFTIAKDIKRETRLRLGGWTAEEITPLDALKAYLESKKVSQERAKLLLQHGEKLIQEQRNRQG
ncbi:MAG: exonuclease SbcCD subunit D, partial [Dehalococcoidia bacterium]